MKTIIVPTDFSEIAENAIDYACEMNKKLDAEILLVNSYFVPILAGDLPVIPVTNAEMKDGAIASLTRTKEKYEKKYSGMKFNIQAVNGMTDDEIVNISKIRSAEFIIMGTNGSSGLGELLMGTNTAAVMEKASCPVLAVPENAIFNGLQEIVFAADYGNHNFRHMHKLIEIARLFDSTIIILHVSSEKADDPFDSIEIQRFKEQVSGESNYPKITYRLIEDKDVYHGVCTYVEQFRPHLLALSIQSRSLFQKIFSRSLTKRLAYHSHIPVLAMHIHAK